MQSAMSPFASPIHASVSSKIYTSGLLGKTTGQSSGLMAWLALASPRLPGQLHVISSTGTVLLPAFSSHEVVET